MAPSIPDFCDVSLSSHSTHDVYDPKRLAPLHEMDTEILPKRVSFSRYAAVQEIPTLDTYSDDEIEASWFQDYDMMRMKQTARTEAKLVEWGRSEKILFRGLESKTRDGAERKRTLRMNAYLAVFFEIECQDENNCRSDEAIARAYSFYSQPSAMSAQALGEQDALEAMKIYNLKSNFFKNRFPRPDENLEKNELVSMAA